MRVRLIPADGSAAVELTKDVALVGRGDDCDLRVDHKSVSKRHCVLVVTDGLVLLRDLGSTNGTRVNGTRVRRAALLALQHSFSRLPGLVVEHNPHQRKRVILHWQRLGLALTTHQAVAPGVYLHAVLLATPSDMPSACVAIGGRPGAGVAKREARAIPPRMSGPFALPFALRVTIEGAVAGHAHNRHQIGVLAMGMQVRRLTVLAVGDLDTQLVVKGECFVLE